MTRRTARSATRECAGDRAPPGAHHSTTRPSTCQSTARTCWWRSSFRPTNSPFVWATSTASTHQRERPSCHERKAAIASEAVRQVSQRYKLIHVPKERSTAAPPTIGTGRRSHSMSEQALAKRERKHVMTTIENIRADVAYWLRAQHYLEEPQVEQVIGLLTRHQWRGHIRRQTDPHKLAIAPVASLSMAQAAA